MIKLLSQNYDKQLVQIIHFFLKKFEDELLMNNYEKGFCYWAHKRIFD